MVACNGRHHVRGVHCVAALIGSTLQSTQIQQHKDSNGVPRTLEAMLEDLTRDVTGYVNHYVT